MKIRLRYFDADGEQLDSVVIYRSGNSANVPGRATWVEVTVEESDQPESVIPEAARKAAQDVRYGEHTDIYTWNLVAEKVLEAATPLIRAAERERIAQPERAKPAEEGR